VKIGLSLFLENHLKEHLKLDKTLNQFKSNKEVLIAFNKKDMLDSKELGLFIEMIKSGNNSQNEHFSISLISCASENDEINELLNELKETLSKL
jgi:50S ribosomal subunit-associated GTPase HflX